MADRTAGIGGGEQQQRQQSVLEPLLRRRFSALFLSGWTAIVVALTWTALRDVRCAGTPTWGRVLPRLTRKQTNATDDDASSSAAGGGGVRRFAVPPGVYPLLRDFKCGHRNMATPRVLLPYSGDDKKTEVGRGRFVVDVGLGSDAKETFDALRNGFVVFSFEIMSGAMDNIRRIANGTGVSDRLHFVEFEAGPDGWAVPKELPKPPKDGRGFAYIFNAGLSDVNGSMESGGGANPTASVAVSNNIEPKPWRPGMVPLLPLETALPGWAERFFFIKIDTQGHEARVLGGMDRLLRSGAVQYVLYEFSPWLMRRAGVRALGDPLELLGALPAMGAVCFDMIGTHNKITRPSRDLEQYFGVLDGGMNGNFYPSSNAFERYQRDSFGPWEDIMCWFPHATD